MGSEKNGQIVEMYTIPTSETLPKKKIENQKSIWSIDKEMLRFKIHYFLITGTFGICMPYVTIFAQKRIGVSASAQAAILAGQRVIFLFAKPSIGYIADYFKKLKAIICALTVIISIFLFSLLAVPKYDSGTKKETFLQFENKNIKYEPLNNSKMYMVCEFNQSNSPQSAQALHLNDVNHDGTRSTFQLSDFLNQCYENNNGLETTGNIAYNITVLEQAYLHSNSSWCNICCKVTENCQRIDYVGPKFFESELYINKSEFQRYQFWLYAFLSTIFQGAANNLYTLTDTACCESVQKTGAQFGRQCLWGGIGWGLMSPVGGLLNDYTGDFLASWILMVIMTCFALLNISKLQIETPAFSKNLLKDIGTVLSSKEFLAFMFCVVMNGVGIGIIWFYLVLFLTDIGGSRFLCGMVFFVQNLLAGIPFMFFSGWVIKKIGHFNILIVSLLAYSIRFFWYSQLHNPWFVLPVEVLHGFTEGLLYTSVASYAKMSAKPGTEATTQAMLFTAHEGIGIGIGCVVAGLGFDSIGGHRTFLYLSIYAACAMVLAITLRLLVRKQTRSINVSSSRKHNLFCKC